MQRLAYESAAFKDPELPVIFHLDTTWPGRPFNIHWQDSLEMLYMVEGEAEVSSDTLRQVIRTGEIAVINSGHIHEIRALTPVTRYYCLLAERELCEQLGAPVGQVQFCLRVSDAMAREYFDRIVDEMLTRSAYYKPAVRADLGGLLVHLCRHWVERKEFDGERKDKRLDMVKRRSATSSCIFPKSFPWSRSALPPGSANTTSAGGSRRSPDGRWWITSITPDAAMQEGCCFRENATSVKVRN